MNNTTDLKSFSYLENGRVQFSILDTIKTTKKLDSGLYSIYKQESYNNPEVILTKESENIAHDLIRYHFIDRIEVIFSKFFDKNIKEEINSLNFKHKLGILLHGKQGTSKSSILEYFYLKAIREENALVFYFGSNFALKELRDIIANIRKIQNNPIIIYLDEFDVFFRGNSNQEEFFKTFMDGHLSIDNCIFLMSTNYLELIPKTISERPSRIKYLFEVEGLQDENLIENTMCSILNKKVLNDEEKAMCKTCIGKTVDEMKEILIDRIMSIKTTNKKQKLGFQ